jgi:tetratricopeptide (TPR) repeat protein
MTAATKPEGTADDLWNRYRTSTLATCYAIAGNVAYERNDYPNAISNLENSIKHFKRNDLAYYYLGLSYWQQNRIDIAMLNLAKAYLLKGSAAASAKQHLDNLYKSTHGQSLVGQDRVLARAAQDLK